jgi:hypothetical protein
MAVNILDKYYLTITLLVTVAYQLSGFFIAWTLQVSAFRITQRGCKE